jgi:hypothetical protein
VRALLDTLSAAVAGRWPGLRLRWAVSTSGHDVLELPRALNEARAAMDAARRLGTAEACFYDELGVVRLLVGGHEDPDLKEFVAAVTQPLLDYDASHDGALLATLRASRPPVRNHDRRYYPERSGYPHPVQPACPADSASLRRMILPDDVAGRLSTKTTRRGRLYAASWSRLKSMSSASVTSAPSRRTT